MKVMQTKHTWLWHAFGILLVALLALGLAAQEGQGQITSEGNSRYTYVILDQDTISRHLEVKEAYESALFTQLALWADGRDETVRVMRWQSERVEPDYFLQALGDLAAGDTVFVRDTLWLPQDTVFLPANDTTVVVLALPGGG